MSRLECCRFACLGLCFAASLCATTALSALDPVAGFERGWTFVREGRDPTLVDIPHDGAIDFGFDWERWASGCGALPYAGHGEYVKRVTLSPAGRSWRLEVDGAMSFAKVFVNGRLAAERPFGYASFVVPLSDGFLVEGENEFRITVDPLVVGTETCSTASSRGIYDLQTTNLLSVARQVLSFDLYPVHHNDYPPDVEFAAQEANPHCCGEFVWTGFDYLGEPDPWRGKARSSYFGIFDLAGFPKDRYWLYRSQWRPDVPTAHILPHWNWKAGDVVPVHVYSSGDEAELFVNGVLQVRSFSGRALLVFRKI